MKISSHDSNSSSHPAGNNGLAIHTPAPEAVATYEGLELQILDNEAPQYAGLEAFRYHGSVYGLVPTVRGYLRPTGEWNDQEVTVDGDHFEVLLNGFQIRSTITLTLIFSAGTAVGERNVRRLATAIRFL